MANMISFCFPSSTISKSLKLDQNQNSHSLITDCYLDTNSSIAGDWVNYSYSHITQHRTDCSQTVGKLSLMNFKPTWIPLVRKCRILHVLLAREWRGLIRRDRGKSLMKKHTGQDFQTWVPQVRHLNKWPHFQLCWALNLREWGLLGAQLSTSEKSGHLFRCVTMILGA